MSKCEKVKLIDVCNRIFAGGDVPKGNYSLEKNEKFNVPIYTNGEKNLGLYGYTDTAKVFEPSVTISARGTIGFAAVRTVPFYPAIRLITLTPNERIDVRFLYYITQNYQFNKGGTSIPQLTVPMLKNYTFPLPDIEKQKRIVSVFDKLNFLIDLLNSEIKKLDELIKSRFVEMFGDPYLNNKNWDIDNLGKYMTVLTDFSANGSYELLDSHVTMYDEPNYAVMVRTADLESGDFKDDLKYIDKEAYELLSKSKLYGGELIMNKIGSAGNIYIMPALDYPASLGRNAFMFRFDERICITFLYYLLSSEYGKKEIQQHVRGAVTKTITKDSTRKIRVIVPPIELQTQFANFVEKVEKQKSAVQKSIEKLEILKKSLMQEYFG